jgi:hypothetical protein
MKRLDGPNDLARALAANQQLLDAINGDLDRMPAFKRGTTWHTDRVREQQALLARRDMLRGFVRRLAESN